MSDPKKTREDIRDSDTGRLETPATEDKAPKKDAELSDEELAGVAGGAGLTQGTAAGSGGEARSS